MGPARRRLFAWLGGVLDAFTWFDPTEHRDGMRWIIKYNSVLVHGKSRRNAEHDRIASTFTNLQPMSSVRPQGRVVGPDVRAR